MNSETEDTRHLQYDITTKVARVKGKGRILKASSRGAAHYLEGIFNKSIRFISEITKIRKDPVGLYIKVMKENPDKL
jgi:hypothetical protein